MVIKRFDPRWLAALLVPIGWIAWATARAGERRRRMLGAMADALFVIVEGQVEVADASGTQLWIDQLGAQGLQLSPTGAQYLSSGWVVEQRQQQMLDRHEFMTALAGPLKSLVQTEFKLTAQHSL